MNDKRGNRKRDMLSIWQPRCWWVYFHSSPGWTLNAIIIIIPLWKMWWIEPTIYFLETGSVKAISALEMNISNYNESKSLNEILDFTANLILPVDPIFLSVPLEDAPFPFHDWLTIWLLFLLMRFECCVGGCLMCDESLPRWFLVTFNRMLLSPSVGGSRRDGPRWRK